MESQKQIKISSSSCLVSKFLKFSKRVRTSLVLALLFFIVSSCSTNKANKSQVNLGYILNITHAVPMIDLELNPSDKIRSYHFSSGGYLLNNLLTKNLDLAFIGPGPYINAVDKGVQLKLLGSYAYGANSLILAQKFKDSSKEQIRKLRLAVPQFGNTQDLLAKKYLDQYVSEYIAIHPAELEFAFFTGSIDAALVNEPWATILAENSLINADQIFKEELEEINQFPSTLLIARKTHYDRETKFYKTYIKQINQIKNNLKLKEKQNDYIKVIENHFSKISKKTPSEDLILKSLSQTKFSDSNKLNSYLEELEAVAREFKYLKN
ncbi:MAG: ABC transporter substrate-binding protein [Candidatus Caenarcaniphilales bacterium]|nr:ABC transporter substrate-binding protein [Candidatus Caenarcaniphilales bacterium]